MSANVNSEASSTRVELGYILLEQVNIILHGDQEKLNHEWCTVAIVDDSGDAVVGEKRSRAAKTPDSCESCNLVVKHRQGEFYLPFQHIDDFQGSVDSSGCSNCTKERSDAALLLGLLKFVSEIVRVHTLRIQRNPHTGLFLLLVTLEFPHLLETKSPRSMLPSANTSRRNNGLHLATQLVLSMVQSDWSIFKKILQRAVVSETDKETASPRIFPKHFSLSELYLRIRGSTATEVAIESRRRERLQRQDASCALVHLPQDILTDNIAPFLRARSLDHLRCTCSVMHDTLRAVVPGLKLRLYRHQISSLSWMRERETKLWKESEMLQYKDDSADLHRSVTGGQTVLLRSRDGQFCIRVNQITGAEVLSGSIGSLNRNVARGGLLADDPGLGKTITVLSLVLQTAGLSSSSLAEKPNYTAPTDEIIFDTYWRDGMTADFRRPLLMKLLNEFCRQNRAKFPIAVIQDAIGKDKYRTRFDAFVEDVERMLNSYASNDDGRNKRSAMSARRSLRALSKELMERQMRSARKSFSSALSKPNSEVAALLEESNRHAFLSSLVQSRASLLVVPFVLLDHWQTQINSHVSTLYLSSDKPLVYEFGRTNFTPQDVMRKINSKTRRKCFPFMFIDRAGTRDLPPPEFLSIFHIVLTTTSRMTNEWKNGSFQSELERDKKDGQVAAGLPSRADSTCSLLRVRWLRLCIDEGHTMAKSQGSAIQFASWISAERRWAMTGTPTKHSERELTEINGLMKFLEHDFFNQRLDGNYMWSHGLLDPWRRGQYVGWFRLRRLLCCLMKRHTKLDIAELPAPHFEETIVPMSPTEVTTYNTLVCGVQSNIAITGMAGETSGAQDSLLHRSQAKNARVALANIRRVCVGYSRVIPTLATKFFVETVDLLKMHGCNEEEIRKVEQYMHNAEAGKLTKCRCCSIQISMMLVFPCCGGVLCPECFDGTNSCILCDQQFDIDDFQRLQPGFILDWQENLSARAKSLKSNPSESATLPNTTRGQSEVHEEVNAAQPNPLLVQNGVLRPAPELRRTRRFGDGHECIYTRAATHGKCTLCLTEHDRCHLINSEGRCRVCFREAEECPVDESKSHYLASKLLALYQDSVDRPKGFAELKIAGKNHDRPLKVIVFSQFRQGLNMTGSNLLRRFGSACVAEYWGKYRTEELKKFTLDDECFCMMLGRDGSEGLDLSFVTHIFFLEEIMDQSLKDQAVARAWRMGAAGRVHVETLTAHNTVEVTMQKIHTAISRRRTDLIDESTQGGASLMSAATSGKVSEYKRAKTEVLLRSLKLITDCSDFNPPGVEQEPQKSVTPKVLATKRESIECEQEVSEPELKRKRLVSFSLNA